MIINDSFDNIKLNNDEILNDLIDNNNRVIVPYLKKQNKIDLQVNLYLDIIIYLKEHLKLKDIFLLSY